MAAEPRVPMRRLLLLLEAQPRVARRQDLERRRDLAEVAIRPRGLLHPLLMPLHHHRRPAPTQAVRVARERVREWIAARRLPHLLLERKRLMADLLLRVEPA